MIFPVIALALLAAAWTVQKARKYHQRERAVAGLKHWRL